MYLLYIWLEEAKNEEKETVLSKKIQNLKKFINSDNLWSLWKSRASREKSKQEKSYC